MDENLDSYENRYHSPKYVELWAADQGLEARRIEWRKRLVASLPFDSSDTLRILDIGNLCCTFRQIVTKALMINHQDEYHNFELFHSAICHLGPVAECYSKCSWLILTIYLVPLSSQHCRVD